MGKKVNKKALTQAEVKKGYGLDEYFRDTLDSTTFFAELYWVCGKIAPAELTFSQDSFPYNDTDDYITRIDEDATIRATYWGTDTKKDGNLYIEPYEYYDRDAIFIATADTFRKIMSGDMDPVWAFTIRKLKVEGNIEKALKLKDLLDRKK